MRFFRPRIVVLGCGNPSRGDDAVGPALLERVNRWIKAHPDKSVAAVEDFQLQVEHILDLEDRDLALFVDAAASGPDPYTLTRIAPQADSSFTTHAISPQAVLHAFRALGNGEPPPSFVLGVRGHSFELGEGLSPEALHNLESAWVLIEHLLEKPSLECWERCCTQPRFCDCTVPLASGFGLQASGSHHQKYEPMRSDSWPEACSLKPEASFIRSKSRIRVQSSAQALLHSLDQCVEGLQES